MMSVVDALAGLILPLSLILMAAFLGLALWALVLSRTDPAAVPPRFLGAVNAAHALWLLALVVALLAGGGRGGMRRVLEYLLLFVGGGVLYTRGLMPRGWVWRVLTDPPKVPWGMVLGNGWNVAAVLGYAFFFLSGGV